MLNDHINRELYIDNIEKDAIFNAVQPEIDLLHEMILRIFHNGFPAIAELEGIVQWETLLGIVADPSTENIEFRRFRIINRIASSLPYTERMLHQIMDSIVGEDGWSYILDVNDYYLHITSLRPGRLWLHEMDLTLERIIPANMRWTLNLYLSTWRTIFEDYETWEDVYNKYDTWEDVYHGIER